MPLANASDFILATSTLPKGFDSLALSDHLPENTNYYDTPLGVTARCYKANGFLILSENKSGRGYELTNIAPKKAVCLELKDKLAAFANTAGLSLGITKADTLKLLTLDHLSDDNTLLYSSQVIVDGKKFDQQTWVDIQFNNDLLSRFALFESTAATE